jgi:hypothetical protein
MTAEQFENAFLDYLDSRSGTQSEDENREEAEEPAQEGE